MVIPNDAASAADHSRAHSLMGEVDAEKKLAMVLLIKQLMIQLNEIAYLKKRGAKAELSMYLFQEIATVLKELEPDLLSLYYDYLMKFVSDSSAPKDRSFSESYAQAAAPARKRFVKRMKTELIAQAA